MNTAIFTKQAYTERDDFLTLVWKDKCFSHTNEANILHKRGENTFAILTVRSSHDYITFVQECKTFVVKINVTCRRDLVTYAIITVFTIRATLTFISPPSGPFSFPLSTVAENRLASSFCVHPVSAVHCISTAASTTNRNICSSERHENTMQQLYYLIHTA